MADAPQHQADERSDEGDQRGDVELLYRAAWLQQAAKDSPDIGMMMNGAMLRFGMGIGVLARDRPEDFEVLYDAARTMLEEIPEDQLHQIDAGKPAK